MEELRGGRKNSVFLVEGKVVRPSGDWSHSIHRLLMELENNNFHCAPKFFGFDKDGNETLSFIEGEVYNYPLKGAIKSETAICTAAKLLKRYHDASVNFAQSEECKSLVWMLPKREPVEVICHGDFAPYNVALNGGEVSGMFDFDTAHPAPRIWDVAYAVYCWSPFKTDPADSVGTLSDQIYRARLFCDSYGLQGEARSALVGMMILRLQTLVDFMQAEADKGNQAFIDNISDGHHLSYLNDMEYLRINSRKITEALVPGI